MRYKLFLCSSLLLIITGCSQATAPTTPGTNKTPVPAVQQNATNGSNNTNINAGTAKNQETDLQGIQQLGQKLETSARDAESLDMDTSISDEN